MEKLSKAQELLNKIEKERINKVHEFLVVERSAIREQILETIEENEDPALKRFNGFKEKLRKIETQIPKIINSHHKSLNDLALSVDKKMVKLGSSLNKATKPYSQYVNELEKYLNNVKVRHTKIVDSNEALSKSEEDEKDELLASISNEEALVEEKTVQYNTLNKAIQEEKNEVESFVLMKKFLKCRNDLTHLNRSIKTKKAQLSRISKNFNYQFDDNFKEAKEVLANIRAESQKLEQVRTEFKADIEKTISEAFNALEVEAENTINIQLEQLLNVLPKA